MTDVRIVGAGMTPFGDHAGRTGRELFGDAARRALEDASLPADAVDELFFSAFAGELSESQSHQGPLMASAAGVSAPATRVEAACASGGAAVRQAVTAIRAGVADVVLVGGGEKLTHLSTPDATEALSLAADERWETRIGTTFPGAYALMTRAYFDRFGADRTDLAHVAVKNHANAVDNELAQYRNEITVEDVLEAPIVSEPLGLFDSCPLTDGAAALVLASDDVVRSRNLPASVAVAGVGQASDRLSLQERDSLCETPATETAAERAYAASGIGPSDVDLAEVHDCFTIAEVLAIEGLGFAENGEGYGAARDGTTTATGSIPVNLSGGLKAKGHPVGATGVAQIAELVKLLTGGHANADAVPDATVGLAHNAGGTVASAVVTVLEVVE
ncbi:thiolase domain-containing protein [Natrarchaeobius oligotrophus]|uniref:Thiolase domain-containing protein n=1 Tax=Natrarchaeobius chitinivorans TaxID=1679083 RepID=A0A3N6MSX1_NATCH|nr:thiolase domain-containing protein [Natrarchaeobius chitinivorans]RQG99431.1 thiolase domain-containing protein [Natrarchaeobius chitinivorans]